MKKQEEKYWIERNNDLNAFKPKGMTLTEVRFLAIYQAKINARKPEEREVIFSLKDFMKIMNLKQVNTVQIKKIADSLICKPVHIPDGKGGLYIVPLFNECYIFQDELTGEWNVKIECHSKVMPYMFEMKKNYFKYQLWNALRLTSVNQIRMYEILKQYEKIGTRTIYLDELKELLGINKNQYERYEAFNRRVLEPCQKALEENTDIKFDYTPIRKIRKIVAIQFNISKNKNFEDVLQLDKFIDTTDLDDIKSDEVFSKLPEPVKIPKDLYKECFTSEHEKIFKDNIRLLLQDIYSSKSMIQARTEEIFKRCVTTFKINSKSTVIKSPMAYMQGIINNLVDDERKNPKKEKRRSYDINQFERFAINYDELQKVYEKEKMD